VTDKLSYSLRAKAYEPIYYVLKEPDTPDWIKERIPPMPPATNGWQAMTAGDIEQRAREADLLADVAAGEPKPVRVICEHGHRRVDLTWRIGREGFYRPPFTECHDPNCDKPGHRTLRERGPSAITCKTCPKRVSINAENCARVVKLVSESREFFPEDIITLGQIAEIIGARS